MRKYTQTPEEFRRGEERRTGKPVRFYGEDHPERCRAVWLGGPRRPGRLPLLDTTVMDAIRRDLQRRVDENGEIKTLMDLDLTIGMRPQTLQRFLAGNPVCAATILLLHLCVAAKEGR